MFLVNAQSIGNKLDLLVSINEAKDFDIMAITESWTKMNILPSYNLLDSINPYNMTEEMGAEGVVPSFASGPVSNLLKEMTRIQTLTRNLPGVTLS
jgi:hypothetical protein